MLRKTMGLALVAIIGFTACEKDGPKVPENLEGYTAKESDFFGGGTFNREPSWFLKSGREGKFAEVGRATEMEDKDFRITRFESFVDGIKKLRDNRLNPIIEKLELENEDEFKKESFEVLKTLAEPKFEYKTASGNVFTYVDVDRSLFLFTLDNMKTNIPSEKMKALQAEILK